MYGARDYARIYQKNAVVTASPGQLVLLLYDGALKSLAIARAAFDRPKSDHRRFQIINGELVKAQTIFLELKATLNHKVGGDFARRMAGLYDYYVRRLREANLKGDVGAIVEVEALLVQIRDAWAEMLKTYDPTKESAAPAVAAQH